MSSYYDDASLMLLASGGAQKDGKVYSVKPTDGSGDFTFTRGSNLSATRVDASQLIEKGRENLALSSNDISTQSTFWSSNQGGATTQNSAVAPDGTTTASTITGNGSNQYSGVSQIIGVNASRYTYSVYLKSVSGTPLVSLIYTDPNGLLKADFNLSTSWQRYDFTFTATTGNNSIYITSAQAVSWNAWGAQFELGLVSTSLIETGATTAQAGILENTPRFDYSGGATCPSLLLEPSRTNQIVQSEYFGGWTANATITANAALSPEGVQNAYNIASNSGVGNGILVISGVLSSTQYVCSLYVKSAGATTGQLRLFDGSTGASTTTTFTPTSEWQRVEVTRTSGAGTFQFRTDLHSNDGDLLIYGAVLEAGSYKTSYIPTYGVSQTRAQDATTITDLQGKGVYPSLSEGTFFLDLKVSGARDSAGSYRHIRLVDNIDSSTNRIRIWENSSGNDSSFRVDFSGGNVATTFVSDTQNKIAVTWGSNGIRIIKNGAVVNTSASQLVFASTQKVLTNVLSNYNFNQVLMFPTALSDLDCEILTGATTYNTFAAMALALNYTVYE